MKNTRSHNFILYLPLVVCLLYIVWWLGINKLDWPNRDNYTDTYSLVALTGAIAGIVAGRKWGLFHSKFGRVLGFFALGLLGQFFGQLIYALYFRVGDVELAFPSVGDIPFLITGIFYFLGVYNLLKVIVYKGNIFKPWIILVTSILATALLLWLMYISFLNIALQDERGTIYSLTNASYSIIQAFYFLLGLVALMQARRMSGGKMLKPVAIMLVALIMQYLADFSFLYQAYHDTWEAAASNDLFYVIAYGAMALSILLIDRTRRQVVVANEAEPRV